MSKRMFRTGLAAAAALVLLAAACGGDDGDDAPADEARGDDEPAEDAPAEDAPAEDASEPATLRMAATGGFADRQIDHLLDTATDVSGGDLRIEIASEWDITATNADVEQQIVEAVAAGEVDLGWVGSRAFAELGLTSFAALTAPLLVDSYPLQQAVLDSDIPDRMLASLDELEVTGLAVVAGGLRKPSGVNGPLSGPGDYAGITFHAWHAAGNADAVTALGATHTDVAPVERDRGLRDGTIDGYENTLLFYEDDVSFAPYITLNVSLWPATGVVLANPDALDQLSDTQAAWLREALADTAARSVELADVDGDQLESICSQGGLLAEASDDDLAAIGQAVEPVHAELAQDDETAAFITEIETLKQSVSSEPPAIPDGCAAEAP